MAGMCRLCGRIRQPIATARCRSRYPATPPSSAQPAGSSRKWVWTGWWFSAGTAGERRLAALLTEKLNPTHVDVRDISGGCGSMYEIEIDSELFQGKRLLQQHRMVNEALGDEMKALHGLTIRIGSPNRTS